MDLKKLEDRISLLPADGIGGKKDLLPLYADKEALGALVTYLAEPFRGIDRDPQEQPVPDRPGGAGDCILYQSL